MPCYRLAFLFFLLQLLECRLQAQAEFSVQLFGQYYKYQLMNFTLLLHEQPKQFGQQYSSPSTKIIRSLIADFKNAHKSAQLFLVSGSGLIELTALTAPHRQQNIFISIRQNPMEFSQLHKNLYINGVQNKIILYCAHVGSQNYITTSDYQQGRAQKCGKDCYWRVYTKIGEVIRTATASIQGIQHFRIYLKTQSTLHLRKLLPTIKELFTKYQVSLIVQLQEAVPVMLFGRILTEGMKIFEATLMLKQQSTFLQLRELNNKEEGDSLQLLIKGVYIIGSEHGLVPV